MWNHTVAILIGGQSRRMGTPKHTLQLPDGRTMLDVMLEFATATASNVVIVGGDAEGFQCIHDTRDKQGPVAGIESLLKSRIDQKYLVVGCDMPQITVEIVTPLLSCCDDAAIFSCDGKHFGLPLMVRSDIRAVCTAYLDSGGRSIKGLISEIPHAEISISEQQLALITSVNTLDDFNNLPIE